MKPIARFVYRTEDGVPNFLMGVFFKNPPDDFQDGDVWQIEEVLDTYVLKKVGKSVIGPPGYHPGVSFVNWNMSVNDILENGQKYTFLTKDEYKAVLDKEKKERKKNG